MIKINGIWRDEKSLTFKDYKYLTNGTSSEFEKLTGKKAKEEEPSKKDENEKARRTNKQDQ